MASTAPLTLCDGGCESEHPGHVLTFTRFSLATSAKKSWADALVESTEEDGRLKVRLLEDDTAFELWHHQDLTGVLPPGSPIAFNTMFWLLAGEGVRLSVQPNPER